MRAQQQTIAQGLVLLTGNDQRVLGIARRMIRGEIERLEIVIVGLDFRPFRDGLAH